MRVGIDSSHAFLKQFSIHLQGNKIKDFWIYSGHREYGALLVKNMADEKRILFKPWDTKISIGRTKINEFINNNHQFKGQYIDRYIFLGKSFRDNAKRYARAESSIALIELSFDFKKIGISGSINIEKTLMHTLIKFADSINYESNFDYEGVLRHQGFAGGVQQVKKMEEPISSPVVFISYSWDSEEHKLWVMKLSADLIRSGIRVILDEWDLSKYQNDLQFFMESGIRESDHVIMVCTREYAKKANIRKGGVGIENTIITGEFFDKVTAGKYIPIVREYSEAVHDCLPSYVKTKYAIDFKNDDKYDQKLEELIRRILNVPKYEKPKLGKLPKLKSNNI